MNVTVSLFEQPWQKNGQVLETNVTDQADGDVFRFSIDTSELRAGQYGWIVEITDPGSTQGRIIALVSDTDTLITVEEGESSGGGGFFLPSPPQRDDPGQFRIGSVDAPSAVETGFQFSVGPTIKNVGDGGGRATVTVSIDEQTVAERDVVLPADRANTYSFDLTAPETAGPVDLTVETPDDQYTTTVRVVHSTADGDQMQDSDEPTRNDRDGTDGIGDAIPGFGITAALVAVLVGLVSARVTA